MPTGTPKRSVTLSLGGTTVRQVGEPPVAPPSEGDDLKIIELSADTVVSESAIYIMTTGGLNRTVTLPILTSTPVDGFHIIVVRIGAEFVYVEPNAADDYWDGTTQKTISDNAAAHTSVVGENGTTWNELGKYRTVF